MKKTPAKHLSNREYKSFETVYMGFRNHPFWRMENIFVDETREHYELCEQVAKVFSGLFRSCKTNRLEVAAHEAGHAIVIAGTYGAIDEAVIDIKDHPDGWLGWVTPSSEHARKEKIDNRPADETEMPSKPVIKRDILIKSGGFVGESFVGRKAGSYHEKPLVYFRCRYLDEVAGERSLVNWTRYVTWCEQIIRNNETLFWMVIDDLLANSKLSNTVKTELHDKIKKEPSELFF